jgi:uncharacterized protein YggE
MNRWILPAAGGGLVAALLAVGVLAAVDNGPKEANAQSPTTLAPTTVAPGVTAAPGVTRTVSVDGVGVVSGTPDTVTLSLGVAVQEATASEALQQSSSKAQSLIETLTDAGVAKADIQTGYVSLWPRYRDSSETLDGYWASNSVTAVIHQMDKAGSIIDAATDAVGDGITLGGVSFSIDDTSGLYAQARQMAVEEARRRADQLAQAAGASVGTVISMNESAQEIPMPAEYRTADAAAGSQATSIAPPIEPGRQNLQLSVQVVFELTV